VYRGIRGMRIRLGLPVDDTFLSHLVYEGLLYTVSRVGAKTKLGLLEAELPDDAFRIALGELNREQVERINLNFLGNDLRHHLVSKFLEAVGLREMPTEDTYRAVLQLLRENSGSLILSGDIDLIPTLGKTSMSIDLPSKRGKKAKEVAGKEELAAPALFKIDRYTGITSAEEEYTSKQVGLKVSPHVWLLGLLGVYSSFAVGARYAGKRQAFYFVFFAPDVVTDVLARGDTVYLSYLMDAKAELIREVARVFAVTHIEEALLLDIAVNANLPRVLEERGLEAINFSVFKVSPEEGRTYKVYEYIPVTLTRTPVVLEVVRKYSSKPEKIMECLSEAVNPENSLVRATGQDWPDSAHALNAILSLHRFVSLGDLQGLSNFAAFLRLAADATSLDRGGAGRAGFYRRILSCLTWL